jgi:MFS family permease
MICARVVNGFGTGILNAIVPVWATETAQHTSRGRFVSIQFSVNIFGIFAAYWLEYGLSFVRGGVTALRCRLPIGVQLIPLVALFAIVWLFPESPRWLTKVGREEEAMYVLKRLRGDGTNPTDRGKASAEFRDIRNVADLEKNTMNSSSYFSMLTGRGSGSLHIGRRVRLVVWLQIMQKWVGITAVVICKSVVALKCLLSLEKGVRLTTSSITDQPTIFRLAGYSSAKSQLLSGVNTITYMISTLICVFSLDRIGRRWALYWGSIAQGITMFLLGGFIQLSINAQKAGDANLLANYGAAAASMVFIFTFVFGATWLTVPWAYQAEIFPLAVRSKGNAWGVVGWSIGSGWMVLLCPIMFANIGETTFYIFGAGNLLTIPIVWALYPESEFQHAS